ncbi:MAG: hypothetical protein K9N49_10930 [Candidatus Marinimicrobia bacterium]|nr:hypothetical protein [Candidatus Neomarinimicrobiota bacterium]
MIRLSGKAPADSYTYYLYHSQAWGDLAYQKYIPKCRHLNEANILLLGGAATSIPFGFTFPESMLLP